MVWQSEESLNLGGDKNIFSYNILNGQTQQITYSPAAQYFPVTDGNRIVWADERGKDSMNTKIYAWEPPDTDKDGFTDTKELFIGTDPNKVCGVNAWPPDIDGDQAVTILDMTNAANSYNTKIGDPKYNKRYDMDTDGAITIADLNIIASYFLQRCTTPVMAPLASRPDVNQFIAVTSKVIEAETFKLNSGYADPRKNIFSDTTASGGKGFILWSPGSAQTITSNGFGKATFRVKADVCQGGPKLTIKIDGKILYSQDFVSTSWTDITVNFAAVSGTSHTILVELANDRYRAGICDRNLRFDKVTLL